MLVLTRRFEFNEAELVLIAPNVSNLMTKGFLSRFRVGRLEWLGITRVVDFQT